MGQSFSSFLTTKRALSLTDQKMHFVNLISGHDFKLMGNLMGHSFGHTPKEEQS